MVTLNFSTVPAHDKCYASHNCISLLLKYKDNLKDSYHPPSHSLFFPIKPLAKLEVYNNEVR